MFDILTESVEFFVTGLLSCSGVGVVSDIVCRNNKQKRPFVSLRVLYVKRWKYFTFILDVVYFLWKLFFCVFLIRRKSLRTSRSSWYLPVRSRSRLSKRLHDIPRHTRLPRKPLYKFCDPLLMKAMFVPEIFQSISDKFCLFCSRKIRIILKKSNIKPITPPLLTMASRAWDWDFINAASLSKTRKCVSMTLCRLFSEPESCVYGDLKYW